MVDIREPIQEKKECKENVSKKVILSDSQPLENIITTPTTPQEV